MFPMNAPPRRPFPISSINCVRRKGSSDYVSWDTAALAVRVEVGGVAAIAAVVDAEATAAAVGAAATVVAEGVAATAAVEGAEATVAVEGAEATVAVEGAEAIAAAVVAAAVGVLLRLKIYFRNYGKIKQYLRFERCISNIVS